MGTHPLRQYVTYKPELFGPDECMDDLCLEFGMDGTEVFMVDFVPREQPLFSGEAEKHALAQRLRALRAGRVHCSYWGYPTSFLTKNNFAELTERMGGASAVRAYFGDMTGGHMFARWAQEYELACEIRAQSYVFHMIDYSVIDGAWPFSISAADIRQAMVFMAQQLLCVLEERDLLDESSPVIELENAGWGLEFGTQTNEDFRMLFGQLHDPREKAKIGWEINHLLHAVGCDPDGNARFMLPDCEITPAMEAIRQEWGHDPQQFAMKWVESNVLDQALAPKINALHLSDCAMKEVEFFRNGKLQPPYFEEQLALESAAEKEDYGVNIVLCAYDSHIPLGTGPLPRDGMRALIAALQRVNPGLVLLHELKNSVPLRPALETQLAFLS